MAAGPGDRQPLGRRGGADGGGLTYLIVASSGSSSISVIEMAPGGAMRVADHVIDTLDTRFQGTQALATCHAGDRVFIITGGRDGGLALMTLMPDGRLVLVGSQLQVPGLALDNITAMTAHVTWRQDRGFRRRRRQPASPG